MEHVKRDHSMHFMFCGISTEMIKRTYELKIIGRIHVILSPQFFQVVSIYPVFKKIYISWQTKGSIYKEYLNIKDIAQFIHVKHLNSNHKKLLLKKSGKLLLQKKLKKTSRQKRKMRIIYGCNPLSFNFHITILRCVGFPYEFSCFYFSSCETHSHDSLSVVLVLKRVAMHCFSKPWLLLSLSFEAQAT